MTENDIEEFAELMTVMAESFDSICSPAKTEIYFKALSDLDVEDVKRAVVEIINTRTTASFPKVAEIREILKSDAELEAMLALEKVEKAFSTAGAYRSVVFDDPIIHRTIVALGGWVKLCGLDEGEWKWQKKDFVKMYKAFKERPGTDIPSKLIGITERTNLQSDKPVFIGDNAKCLEWIRKNKLSTASSATGSNIFLDVAKNIGAGNEKK